MEASFGVFFSPADVNTMWLQSSNHRHVDIDIVLLCHAKNLVVPEVKTYHTWPSARSTKVHFYECAKG